MYTKKKKITKLRATQNYVVYKHNIVYQKCIYRIYNIHLYIDIYVCKISLCIRKTFYNYLCVNNNTRA